MCFMSKDKSKKQMSQELPADPVMGQPESCFELINKYGTYEIQPTSDSGNKYPAISQGLSKKAAAEASPKNDGFNRHLKGK